ncbi:MAG: hypothetical protein D6713_04340 [Deltaproteobacteria bacterium]|nr:MAG: hypothetical protein D6713_04340 [Deltaproteobacteria bacterium]
MRNFLKGIAFFVGGIFLLTLLLTPARADEVKESIRAAEKFYEKGNYSEAIKELEFAAQLIRQKKGERLKGVFPDPLPGWKAEKPEMQSAGTAYLGGGISGKRVYRKGSSRVTIEIAMDNPLLQSFLGIMDNPMLIGPDQKLVRVNGQRALLRFDPSSREGELSIAFARKVLVTVRGSGISDEEVLTSYAAKIDYDLLEKVVSE